MSYTRLGLTACLYLFLFSGLSAQVQNGLRVENYSGINGVRFNPAATTTFPLKWDVSLFEVAIHGANNYGFIQKSNLFHGLQHINQLELNIESETPSADAVLIDYYKHNRSLYGIAYSHLAGPSVLIATNPFLHWGISTAFRSMASAQQIDPRMGYANYEDIAYYEPFTIFPARAAAMAWSEIGIHANYISPTPNGKIGFGVHLKGLQGWEAGFLENHSIFSVIRTPGDSILYDRLNVSTGFTNSNLDPEGSIQPQRNGRGMALDVGVVYTIEDNDQAYRWRFGASIVDVGRIQFNKNAEQHRFIRESSGSIISAAYDESQTIDSLVRQVSEDVLGSPVASRSASNFNVWLPTALHLQADYAIGYDIYFHALLSQGIPTGKQQLRRGSLLSFGPRLERRWWGVNVPLSWYNWQDFRFGMSVRLAFLTIGTDDLGSLFGKRSFDSTDLFLSLKINPFSLNWGLEKSDVKCYEF